MPYGKKCKLYEVTNGDHGLTTEDLLHNWTRWVWSGAAVGNREQHIPMDDDAKPINHWHAQQVGALHRALPWHEQIIITAEYPQKHVRFAGLNARNRSDAARRWILQMTDVAMTDVQYKLYLGFFKQAVKRVV